MHLANCSMTHVCQVQRHSHTAALTAALLLLHCRDVCTATAAPTHTGAPESFAHWVVRPRKSRCTPAVTVTPPWKPIDICKNAAEDHVDVAFSVVADNRDFIDIPATINATDGRVCTKVTRENGESATMTLQALVHTGGLQVCSQMWRPSCLLLSHVNGGQLRRKCQRPFAQAVLQLQEVMPSSHSVLSPISLQGFPMWQVHLWLQGLRKYASCTHDVCWMLRQAVLPAATAVTF
jgi:hypothetical protein